MQKIILLKLLPSEASNEQVVREQIAGNSAITTAAISGYHIQKRSIDARGKNIFINLTLLVYIDEPFKERSLTAFAFKDVSHASKKVVIIGAGPAGLFSALKLLEAGIQPIILERGKDVRARRRDLALLNKHGIINAESNYCFGEGGAGTYSDGKLYTRSNKRGDIQRILSLFVHFGAPESILYDSHPHIGTNKLPGIITSMTQLIRDCGGKVLFEKKLADLQLENGKVISVQTEDGELYTADGYIFATGHSARDIYTLFQSKKIHLEPKPFSLGVRVEHPQSLIDSIQYHCISRGAFLPPASYSLVQQVNEKGVFSFCMCPGGIIAPASTSPGELVVNGWSPSKRNNPFANSGMVVQVGMEDAFGETKHLKLNADDPLILMHFQQSVEQRAFISGGGNFVAPAMRMVDFTHDTVSTSLPVHSYLPGLHSADLKEVLPSFIYHSLAKSFIHFGRKMKGFFTNDAVVVATESRTSSPVRIPRDPQTFSHPQFENLYPCGEGAGYAGGIVSAAMDAENIAAIIIKKLIPS